MIAQEHHGLFTAFVGNIDHFFSQLRHFAALECLEIAELLARNPVIVVVIALIDNKFRSEFITCLLLKLFEDIRADGG
ncbi:hypothetical protein D3C76_1067730 [compost metagenome]